jgi:hypothetical protein
MTVTGLRPADTTRQEMVSKLEGGFDDLCRLILKQTMGQQNTLAGIAGAWAGAACWDVLLLTDSRVLRCLLEGNIVTGISVSSANKVKAKRWKDFEDWVADMSPYIENDRAELRRWSNATRRRQSRWKKSSSCVMFWSNWSNQQMIPAIMHK